MLEDDHASHVHQSVGDEPFTKPLTLSDFNVSATQAAFLSGGELGHINSVLVETED